MNNSRFTLLLVVGQLLMYANWITAQCNIEIPSGQICSGDTVVLRIQNPEPGATYEWDFRFDGFIDLTGTEVRYVHPFSFTNSEFVPFNVIKDSVSCGSGELEIQPGPDPSIGVDLTSAAILRGEEIAVCDQPENFNLTIFNTSFTAPVNTAYTINWGDNSPIENLTPNQFSGLIQHEYLGLGFKMLDVTVTRSNGCTATKTYDYYNGKDPSVGLGKPANTTGLCAPETLTFSFSEIATNPPGTNYEVNVNGLTQLTFQQENVPNVFDLLFENSSCNERTSTGKFNNAFDVEVRAINPCAISTATVEPIELSGLPVPVIGIDAIEGNCPGSVFFIRNASTEINEVESGNPSFCRTELPTSWSISGTEGVDWVILEGLPFNSQRLAVRFNNEGSYTINMTMRSSACGLVETQETLVIATAPSFQPVLNGPTNCVGSIFEANVNVDGAGLAFEWEVVAQDQGQWEFENGTNAISENPSFRFDDADTYSVNASVTNGCQTLNWDTLIQISDRPEVSLIPQPIACQQAILNFNEENVAVNNNGNDVLNYSWTFEGASINTSIDPFPTGVSYSGSGVYPFSLAVSNACGITTARDTLRIQEPTELTLPADQTICENDTAVALTAIPAGGIWSGLGINEEGKVDPDLLPTGSNTFTYQFGEGSCRVTGEVDLIVGAIPEIVLGENPDNVCESVDGVILIASPANGIWSSSNNGIINGFNFSPLQSGSGNYQLTYSVIGNNGCANSQTINLLVNSLPDIEVSDTVLCNVPGLTALPLATPVGGNWSGAGISNNEFDPVAAGGVGVYDLTYTFDGGQQCVDSASIRVNVEAPPIIDAGPTDTFCIDGGLITLEGFRPMAGRWSGPGIQDENQAIIDPQLTGGGTFIYSYTVGTGNCSVEDLRPVTIIDLTNTTAGNDLSICFNEGEIALTGATPFGGQWSGPGILDEQQGIFQPAITSVGPQEVFYTFRDDNSGCFFRASKQIEVLPIPASAFDIPEEACIRDSIFFVNNTTNQFLPSWDFGDGNSAALAEPIHLFQDTGLYRVTLKTENEQACVDSFSRDILITQVPNVDFEKDISAGCAPLLVAFNNLSDGYNASYQWDFGNGAQSTSFMPDTVTYRSTLNDTTFLLSLSASNLCGIVTKVDSVRLFSKPTVGFGLDRSSDCSPMTVEFSNVSQGNPDGFIWDLGNGVQSMDSLPPRQIYTTGTLPTIYALQLIAFNDCGQDTLTQDLLVRPVEVKSFFNIFDTVGCQPYTIQFTDFSTPGAFVRWDFGDGNTSSLKDPLYTFENPGTFEVIQRASNGCGYDSTIQKITVLPAPEVGFEHLPEVCIGDTLKFTNNSINTAGDLWRFGDGDSSFIKSPVHVYEQAGSYSVQLRGISQLNGCEEIVNSMLRVRSLPQAAFNVDKMDGCIPLDVNFQNQSQDATYFVWNFNDGNTSIEENPVHTFQQAGEYAIQLATTDEFGCSNDTTFFRIIAYPEPDVDFEFSKEKGCGAPVALAFEGISNETVGYSWDFGEGSTSLLNAPIHIFQNSGAFQVELTATTGFGCQNEISKTINIIPQPVANFEVDPIDGCNPLSVDFINSSMNANRFYWSLGDGTMLNTESPSHTYFKAGIYRPSLIATYDDLCFDTIALERSIQVLPSPKASFTFRENVFAGATGIFEFFNATENASRLEWDFGDGSTSELPNPTHRYYTNGPKEVQLTAFSANGCMDDTTIIVQPEFLGYLHVPNALAPDQTQGEGNIFLPKGVGLATYKLQIFSAYGDLIWETTNLIEGQPGEGWDGTKDGQALPQDTYLWKIEAQFEDGKDWPGIRKPNGKIEPFGSLLLLR